MRLALLLLCAAGCAHPTPAQKAITDLRGRLDSAFARNDPAAAAPILAAATTWCFPGARGCASGADKAMRMITSLHERRPDIEWRFVPSSVEVNEAWGWASEQGRFREQWTEKDGPVVLAGPYFALWQRDADSWKLVNLSFSASECTGGAYCKQ